MAQHALFPGTFDPPTLGHVDVLERAARIFGRVTVVVAMHHAKQALFSPTERIQLWKEIVRLMDGVDVVQLDGLLVDGARALGAKVVIRGVRTARDLDYERQMALTNRVLEPDLETVFLLPAPEHANLSSSLVRQIASMGGDVAAFVPSPVLAALRAR